MLRDTPHGTILVPGKDEEQPRFAAALRAQSPKRQGGEVSPVSTWRWTIEGSDSHFRGRGSLMRFARGMKIQVADSATESGHSR